MLAHARSSHDDNNGNDHNQNWSLSLDLPATPLAATCPPEHRGIARDEVRLLVIDKATGRCQHATFLSLSQFLQAGDVLVVNNSQTIPASLPGVLVPGMEELRLHLAGKISDAVYLVERRTASGAPDNRLFSIGDKMLIEDVTAGDDANGKGQTTVTVLGRFHPQSRIWYVESAGHLQQTAARIGCPIQYSYLECRPSLSDFQTVFASVPGSSEMPSAGRPFSHRVLCDLRQRGVQIAEITLHTGVSSHEVVNGLANHPFLPEWYVVPEATASVVNRAIQEKRRVIAVGTTVVRAIETVANRGRVIAQSGWTTHVVTPETPPEIITGIISGLHESDTSHLALMYGFIAQKHLEHAYAEAVAQGYLWHEFGDSSLIL